MGALITLLGWGLYWGWPDFWKTPNMSLHFWTFWAGVLLAWAATDALTQCKGSARDSGLIHSEIWNIRTMVYSLFLPATITHSLTQSINQYVCIYTHIIRSPNRHSYARKNNNENPGSYQGSRAEPSCSRECRNLRVQNLNPVSKQSNGKGGGPGTEV